MPRLPRISRALIVAVLVIGTSLGLVFLSSPRGWADDRDLLRFDTSKPYLFLILDTSSSMALKMGPDAVWVPGSADNPDSKLFQAKQALYEVFKNVNDLHFGFASYNQDEVRAVQKHWLYFHTAPFPDNWPISFPLSEVDGTLTRFVDTPVEDTDGDGIPDTGDGVLEPVSDINSGDVMTFGPNYPISPVGEAGTCASPLNLDDPTDRNRVQSFAVEDFNSTTKWTIFWVEEAGQVYKMEARLSMSGDIGDNPMNVDFRISPVLACPGTLGEPVFADVPFLLDSFLNEILTVDHIFEDNRDDNGEGFAGLWNWSDVESSADFGTDHPFTGKGWEGNYDSDFDSGSAPFNSRVTNDDPFCSQLPCQNGPKPVEDTLKGVRPDTGDHSPALDSGDMIPLDWQTENRDRFLMRLAPNLKANPANVPDLRVASYFDDAPTSVGGQTVHAPTGSGIRPLAATDYSPLAKSINDFRCWYLGKNGRGAIGKCRQSAFFDEGWENLACEFDSEFGCRRPFLIIISDGEDTAQGEDATADVAALFSQSSVQTWAINLGDPRKCRAGGELHPITQAGRGECLTVATRGELMKTLKDILGQIRESARSFASAAVPSVQATVEQKIFLSNFTPLNDESVWDGHIFSFLKPLPLDGSKPNLDARCDGSGDIAQRETECLLWDVGEEIIDQIAVPPLDLSSIDARRVFYSRESQSGAWPDSREFLHLDAGDCLPAASDYAQCLDLLAGFGLLPDPPPADLTPQETRALTVLQETFALKMATVEEIDPDTGNPVVRNIDYILGDTFHSTPLVLGTPPSAFYFAADLFSDQGDPDATCDSGDNKGYRCFFRKHQYRRRVLVLGSDDGMLHAVDAGNFRTSGNDPITNKSLTDEFDNGVGKEIFAYAPRATLPTIRDLAEGDAHIFGVDGSIAAADVFIDPVFGAAGPDPDEREWRTVMAFGLREGGSTVTVLDITQPDHLNADFEPDDRGSYVPSCTTNFNTNDCGPVPYPSAVWEFTDSIYDAVNGLVRLDEDGNGFADLGDTWSTPTVGLIQVCKPGGTACSTTDLDPANRADLEHKSVAIFGGGMDVESKTTPADPLSNLTPAGSAKRGNWIYIVDVETGSVMYKRQVIGAAASDIAAVDIDQNGFLDRLYVPTIAGLLYRVDIGPDSSGDVPDLDNTIPSVLGMDGNVHTVPPRITSSDWDPRVLFDTLGDSSVSNASQVRRPLYFRPSVFFIAKLGLYGLSFGSGDREDLWSVSSSEGRFWVMVDDTDAASSPRSETTLERIDEFDGATGNDFLLDPGLLPGSRGWYIALGPDERVITDSFALSGVTIFSTFVPRTDITDEDGDPVDVGCDSRGRPGEEHRCAKAGNSNIFAVNTTNANALLEDLSGQEVRSLQTPTYVSNPFAETGTNRDIDSGDDGPTADDLDERLENIMESLKGLFPTNCKFANYRVDVKTIAADTSLQIIAPIPVCLIEKNWKDF